MRARYLTCCLGRELKKSPGNPVIGALFNAAENRIYIRFNDGKETSLPGDQEIYLVPQHA